MLVRNTSIITSKSVALSVFLSITSWRIKIPRAIPLKSCDIRWSMNVFFSIEEMSFEVIRAEFNTLIRLIEINQEYRDAAVQ